MIYLDPILTPETIQRLRSKSTYNEGYEKAAEFWGGAHRDRADLTEKLITNLDKLLRQCVMGMGGTQNAAARTFGVAAWLAEALRSTT